MGLQFLTSVNDQGAAFLDHNIRSTETTFAVAFSWNANSSSNDRIFQLDQNSDALKCFSLYSPGSGTWRLQSGDRVWPFAGATFQQTIARVIVGRWDLGNIETPPQVWRTAETGSDVPYWGWQVLDTAAGASGADTGPAPSMEGYPLWIGNRSDGLRSGALSFYWFAQWNRFLSDQELAQHFGINAHATIGDVDTGVFQGETPTTNLEDTEPNMYVRCPGNHVEVIAGPKPHIVSDRYSNGSGVAIVSYTKQNQVMTVPHQRPIEYAKMYNAVTQTGPSFSSVTDGVDNIFTDGQESVQVNGSGFGT